MGLWFTMCCIQQLISGIQNDNRLNKVIEQSIRPWSESSVAPIIWASNVGHQKFLYTVSEQDQLTLWNMDDKYVYDTQADTTFCDVLQCYEFFFKKIVGNCLYSKHTMLFYS